MVLGLRRKVQLRVRQPLSKLIIPILNDHMIRQLDAVKNIILSEVNVKEIEYITDTTGVLVKKIKPNFKTLGPKYGKYPLRSPQWNKVIFSSSRKMAAIN